MRNSVDPALVASLYSLLLVAVALLMGRRGTTSGLFRGTGVALCVVAFAMPMLRLLTARDVSDLLLLWGAMAASVATVAFLIRPRVQPDSPRAIGSGAARSRSTGRTAGGRTAGGRSATARARRDSMSPPRVATPPTSLPHLVDTARDPITPTAIIDAGTSLAHLGPMPVDAPTTKRAGQALHDVDVVVDDVSTRLGLSAGERPAD